MTRSSILLAAAALLMAATSAPAAQFGAGHNYSAFAGSSWQKTQDVSKCHRVCVKTESHGPASAPSCIQWAMIC
jgi:hypothetical protein